MVGWISAGNLKTRHRSDFLSLAQALDEPGVIAIHPFALFRNGRWLDFAL
tara:strand:- start:157 stop:306 length:150 start_codon:yes stop_codon:yes gene_type:complete